MEILYSDRELVVCVKPVGMDSEHEVPQALAALLGIVLFSRTEKTFMDTI